MAKCAECDAYVHELGDLCYACQKKYEQQMKEKEDRDNDETA